MSGRHGVREIHVVFNTHWDREFRETFEITRRVFNSDTQTQTGRLTFGCRVASVRTAELDESIIGELAIRDSGVDLSVPPKKIVTLLVRS